jgi:hypothetical protein
MPKKVRLRVEITPEDSLRLHRLARTHGESLKLTVNRLIRAGFDARRGYYDPIAIADLPKLPPLPPRKRRTGSSVGMIRLTTVDPVESAATIATAELVREALHGGKKP